MSVESESIAEQSSHLSRLLDYTLAEIKLMCIGSRHPFYSLLEPTIGAIKVYFEQTSAQNTFKNSPSERVIECLCSMLRSAYLRRDEIRNMLVLWYHVLPVLLKYGQLIHNNDSYLCTTMLHDLMSFLGQEKSVDVIGGMTRKLVRHGCPIGIKDNSQYRKNCKRLCSYGSRKVRNRPSRM